MPKPKMIRFASGSPEECFSGVWRMFAQKNDVYIAPSKETMGIEKFSLHESGVWVLALNQPPKHGEGMNGNRRMKRWQRPPEVLPGITRGPTICVPYTSLGSKLLPPGEINKDTIWYDSPTPTEAVAFRIFFIKPEAPIPVELHAEIIAETSLANGTRVALLASKLAYPEEVRLRYEDIVHKNVFQVTDINAYRGSLFDIGNAEQDTPWIVELPVKLALLKKAAS